MILTVRAMDCLICVLLIIANSISFSNLMHRCIYSYCAKVVLGARYSANPHTLKQYFSTFTVSSSSKEQATFKITCSTLQFTETECLKRFVLDAKERRQS